MVDIDGRANVALVQDTYEESVTEMEDLRASHLSEIQSLQSQISRLQVSAALSLNA